MDETPRVSNPNLSVYLSTIQPLTSDIQKGEEVKMFSLLPHSFLTDFPDFIRFWRVFFYILLNTLKII